MRLIDADNLREGWLEWNPREMIRGDILLESIDEQPTIDPIHAADGCYCRECRYTDIVETYCGAKYFECQHFEAFVEADDFCSYGSRREADNE